jgi:hypothetical protein
MHLLIVVVQFLLSWVRGSRLASRPRPASGVSAGHCGYRGSAGFLRHWMEQRLPGHGWQFGRDHPRMMLATSPSVGGVSMQWIGVSSAGRGNARLALLSRR